MLSPECSLVVFEVGEVRKRTIHKTHISIHQVQFAEADARNLTQFLPLDPLLLQSESLQI